MVWAPVISDKGQDYMEKETEIKKQEEENRQYWTNESEDIHQEMYDLATKSGKTTTQLNPVGGSETFQEGPGGWMSGTGYQGQGLTDPLTIGYIKGWSRGHCGSPLTGSGLAAIGNQYLGQ